MQIYSAYALELVLLSFPVLLLQIVNNALLKRWSIEAIASMTILCINLLLDLRGIIVIGDRMAQEKNDNQLRIKIRKHQREKQKVIQK